MDKKEILSIAKTIKSQLIGMNDICVIMSWGVQNYAAVQYKDMAALRFEVNGRLFKGYVIIAYNTYDTYEIYLANNKETVCVTSDATFSEMGDIIDVAIERGTNEEDYKQFCMQEQKKLFIGIYE